MTPLRRLALVTGLMLSSVVALSAGCLSSTAPPLPVSEGGSDDVSHDTSTHDARKGHVDAGMDHTAIMDTSSDMTSVMDSMDSRPADAADAADDADAGTNCTAPIRNGSETDVGCGGPVCPACKVGKDCEVDKDCASPAVCDAPEGGLGTPICQLPSCHDGKKDGLETDIDCGGPTCAPCSPGQVCLGPSDCTSLVCSASTDGGADAAAGTCQAPSCTDGVKNGTETDVDCGGGTCPACIVGKQCIAPTDCSDDICMTGVCSCPVNMVIVPTNLPTGGDYCVDYIEVTYADYNAFWISNPSLLSQASFCSWNTTFTPSNGWPPDLVTTDPGYNGGYPVNWVNWCQAYAYCAQQGKRLCGKIGGGSNDTADSAKAMKSEWYNACSANAVNTYPYGSTFSATACNGSAGPGAPWEELNSSGTLFTADDTCQGGAAGLYQMSGDVAEWEDSCNGSSGATDTCLLRGGSFTSSAAGLTCATAVATARSYQGADSGFRCCL